MRQVTVSVSVVVKRADFDAVLGMIERARGRVTAAVNTELVGLYWQVGEYISKKIAGAEWGEGVVDELAGHIAASGAGARGFSRQNLFRMRQFFEVYRDAQKVSPLVRQLPWTHNLTFLSQSRSHRNGSSTAKSGKATPQRQSRRAFESRLTDDEAVHTCLREARRPVLVDEAPD